jgi:hypothetical protein
MLGIRKTMAAIDDTATAVQAGTESVRAAADLTVGLLLALVILAGLSLVVQVAALGKGSNRA